MSKIKLTGHASGSGTITLTGPNTNSDRTITLPDATGTALMTDGSAASLTNIPAANITGTLPAISGASLTGLTAGITEYDVWRLTTTLVGSADPISSNLSRAATAEFERIGTGMSESSGIFTFPSTGKWIVQFQTKHGANAAEDYATYAIRVSVNSGSSYQTRASMQHGVTTGVRFSNGFCQCLVDVTSTSVVLVDFECNQANTGNYTYASSDHNATAMTFIKIGET